MRRRTWIAAGCALALGVAGCGGGGNRLSKADLVKRGDQLCLAQRAADQKIGATQTVKTLAAKPSQNGCTINSPRQPSVSMAWSSLGVLSRNVAWDPAPNRGL